MKKRIRINEAIIRKMVAESVKRALAENDADYGKIATAVSSKMNMDDLHSMEKDEKKAEAGKEEKKALREMHINHDRRPFEWDVQVEKMKKQILEIPNIKSSIGHRALSAALKEVEKGLRGWMPGDPMEGGLN